LGDTLEDDGSCTMVAVVEDAVQAAQAVVGRQGPKTTASARA